MYKLSISIFLVGWFYKMIILSWKKILIYVNKKPAYFCQFTPAFEVHPKSWRLNIAQETKL